MKPKAAARNRHREPRELPQTARKARKPGFYQRIGLRMEQKPWGAPVVAHVRRYPTIYRWIETIVVAVALALVIRTFIIEIYKIPSGSMEPTLRQPVATTALQRGHPGDQVLVLKFIYRFREPGRGDVVVFDVPKDIKDYDPKKPVYIKRIVGLPGETVEINNERLFVDGKEVVSPPFFNGKRYVRVPDYAPQRVPDGHVLVYGDNTTSSYDSRYWGSVPIRNLRGRAVRVVWPLSRMGAPIP